MSVEPLSNLAMSHLRHLQQAIYAVIGRGRLWTKEQADCEARAKVGEEKGR